MKLTNGNDAGLDRPWRIGIIALLFIYALFTLALVCLTLYCLRATDMGSKIALLILCPIAAALLIYCFYITTRFISRYSLCDKGIYVRGIFERRLIPWSSVKIIRVYAMKTFINNNARYIQVFLSGSSLRRHPLSLDTLYRFCYKSVFAIRATDARLAELAQYWHEPILEGPVKRPLEYTAYWYN